MEFSDIRSEPRNLHVHPVSLLADLLPCLLKQDINLLHQFCLVRRATHYPEQTDHHRHRISDQMDPVRCMQRDHHGETPSLTFLSTAHSAQARRLWPT